MIKVIAVNTLFLITLSLLSLDAHEQDYLRNALMYLHQNQIVNLKQYCELITTPECERILQRSISAATLKRFCELNHHRESEPLNNVQKKIFDDSIKKIRDRVDFVLKHNECDDDWVRDPLLGISYE